MMSRTGQSHSVRLAGYEVPAFLVLKPKLTYHKHVPKRLFQQIVHHEFRRLCFLLITLHKKNRKGRY